MKQKYAKTSSLLGNVTIVMHCNLRPPDTTQHAAVTKTPVSSMKSLNLSVAVLQLFHCRHITLHCELDL